MNTIVPTIAVIITNYNYSIFLPRALDSVLEQTDKFDEIVVVDDGSTDNSLDVLKHYVSLVKVISIPNGGQLGAGCAGIAMTCSDYIYFLDADDYAKTDLVEKVRPLLVGNPVKVQFQLESVDQEGGDLRAVFPSYPQGYNATAMKEDNKTIGFYTCPPTSGNVFSRRALEVLDLRSFNLRDAIDGSPALAIPYLGEISSLSEPLAHYRVHANSVSGWSKPTVQLLQKEIKQFWVRWNEVVLAVNLQSVPFEAAPPLYIREREMMIACLENRIVIIRLFFSFLFALWYTQLPLRQKLILSAWASTLLIPSKTLRQYLIRVKRSSINRSKRLQKMLNFFFRVRIT